MGCNGRTFEELAPHTKIGIQNWAAVGCNGRTFEELAPYTKIAR